MYRAGVIGCGRIGCGFISDSLRGATSTHVGSYMAVEGVDLVAICDVSQERAERCAKESGAHIYSDYTKMLAAEDLDIVSICTPPNTHCGILCSVAGYNSVKAIYCEKPIATSVSAAEAMVRICEWQNILLMVNHQRRFGPLHQKIARIIREGELGRIQQVTCYYGGGVYESGSHLFDLLRFYLGEIGVTQGWWSTNPSHRHGDPNIDGRLWLEGGTPITIQTCDSEFFNIFEIDILGTQGRLRVSDSGRRAEIMHVGPSLTFSGLQEMRESQSIHLSIPRGAPSRWIPRGIEHMLDCLETGRQPISSGEDGLAALRIIEALIASARGE